VTVVAWKFRIKDSGGRSEQGKIDEKVILFLLDQKKEEVENKNTQGHFIT
jgi:hypothetical protein